MKTPLSLLLAFTLISTLASHLAQAEDAAEGVMAPAAEEIQPLEKGKKLPAVTLLNPQGEEKNLAELSKGKPTVVVFYRGGWCPYCNTHLAELGQAEAELRELGYQILALSPDGAEYAAETAGQEEIGYQIYSDNSLTAAKAFGVAFKMDPETQRQYQGFFKDRKDHDFGVLPVPAVFIADKEGIIQFVYTNADYKIRLSKDDLLKAAKEAH